MLLMTTISVMAQMKLNFGDDSPLRKLQIAELAISNLYVDKVDEGKLVEDAIRGMLEKLDPHSSYSTPKEVKALNEPLSGSFEGIGVQFNMVEDTLLVIQPVTGGPSEKVGIVAGDRIVSVNDTAIAGVKMSKEEIMRRLRGPKGTKVMLGIVRRGIKDTLSFKVVRDKIPVKSIDAVYMIRPEVGYVRIGNFGATTHDEFCEALEKLTKQGMRNLILDLQGNGGGYLQAAVNIANEFLQKDDLIVYTEGRRMQRAEYKAKGNGKFLDGKIMVLIDEYSASAAEIVTGAIQDQDRGKVVGRRSFGKGLVQRPIDLPDGSMIRLTVSHYYTPPGRCIQKPYVKGQKEAYSRDLEDRYTRGELTSLDSIHLDSTKVYKTLVKGRTVYGGGGIMPDIFVPVDTTAYTPMYRALRRHNLINEHTLRYVDEHRKELKKKYRTFDDYAARFEVPAQLTDSILAEGKRKKVEPKDDKELAATLDQLKFILKATIAYDLWERNEYFRLINQRSDIFNRAMLFLKNKED